MAWNVLASNSQTGAIAQLLSAHDPDVIVLLEVRPGLLEELDTVARSYDYVLLQPSWTGTGIAMLSRLDTQMQLEDFDFATQPAIVAEFQSPDKLKRIRLVGIHTLSPFPPHRAEIRDRQFRAMQTWALSQSTPVCVCGDFNVTPWAPIYRELIANGFVDSRVGHGLGISWPSYLGPLGIPIDHALTLGECSIVDRQILPEAPGSDHHPLLFTLRY